MENLWITLAFLALFLVLTRVVLPKFGIGT